MDREVAMALYWNFAGDYSFIGGAWLFNFKLVLKGEFYRTNKGKCIFGILGVKKRSYYLINQSVNWISQVFPYIDFVVNGVRLGKGVLRV
jgi:hypothetical protein